MKLNLIYYGSDFRNGYTNVSPFVDPTSDEEADIISGTVSNLDDIVDDGEAVEIIAMDVIDFLTAPYVEEIIKHWVKKLRFGGMLTVGGVDLREVAYGIVNHSISISEANVMLYGQQGMLWDYRKCAFSIQNIISFFKDNGLILERKQLEECRYCIIGRRPYAN